MQLFFIMCAICRVASAQQPYGFYPGSLQNLLNTIGMPPFQIPEQLQFSADPQVVHNYSFTEWSTHKECNKVCGGGMLEKQRNCLSGSGMKVPINMCVATIDEKLSSDQLKKRFLRGSSSDTEVQLVQCNTQICTISTWSSWETCSEECGGGVQTSTRICMNSKDQSLCNIRKSRWRGCNMQNCYNLTSWSVWGDCSRPCSGGTRTRTRSCRVNLLPESQVYLSLTAVLRNIEQHASRTPAWLARNKRYFDEYQEACNLPKREMVSCNEAECSPNTVCPANQRFFSCLPCVKHCNPYSAYNTLSWSESLSYSTGCNFCVPGCACPLAAPFLGLDKRCYSIQSMCPRTTSSPKEEASFPRSGSESTNPLLVATTVTTSQAPATDLWAKSSPVAPKATETTSGVISDKTGSVQSEKTAPSLWTEWSTCTHICGGGMQYATHKCLQTGDCTGLFFKEQRCNTQDCYNLGEWSSWSKCSLVGINCTKTRKRLCLPSVLENDDEYYGLIAAKELGERSVNNNSQHSPISHQVVAHYVGQYQQCKQQNLEELTACEENRCTKPTTPAGRTRLRKCPMGILKTLLGTFDCRCDIPILTVPCIDTSQGICGICLTATGQR